MTLECAIIKEKLEQIMIGRPVPEIIAIPFFFGKKLTDEYVFRRVDFNFSNRRLYMLVPQYAFESVSVFLLQKIQEFNEKINDNGVIHLRTVPIMINKHHILFFTQCFLKAMNFSLERFFGYLFEDIMMREFESLCNRI